MRNRTYGGVRGRKTKVGRKLLRFPPTRFYMARFPFVHHSSRHRTEKEVISKHPLSYKTQPVILRFGALLYYYKMCIINAIITSYFAIYRLKIE